MDMVKRVVGVFLLVTALAAAVLLMVTPLIHDGSPDYPLWKILNWFMAAGTVVILVVAFAARRAQGCEKLDTLERLRVSLVFYGAIVLAMLFFWEWFWTLNPDSETGEAVTSHMVYFPIMDALYVVMSVTVGRRLAICADSPDS
jgi:hypothetical protein